MNHIVINNSSKRFNIIVFWSNSGQIKTFSIKEHMTVGRDSGEYQADINLAANFISRKHGELDYIDGKYYYTDLKSTSVTYLNGKRMNTDEKTPISVGDTLQIFYWQDGKITDSVTFALIDNCPTDYENYIYEIDENFNSIAVGANEHEYDTEFYIAKEKPAVKPCSDSANIYINGNKTEKASYLMLGDYIRVNDENFFFGKNRIVYQCPIETKHKPSDGKTELKIKIVERSVKQHSKKISLLKDIALSVDTGEMVLILGGSGAGKTTFMNAVMGYEKADGSVMFGNRDLYADFESMKRKIGFVPQQDLLRGSATVYDTLKYAADMKLPGDIAKSERDKRITDVLRSLGLEREKGTLVSKLSGGQRKRMSIAVEYIANPQLFFLDEPDSGLDGIMAKSLMQDLRFIADENKLVMVITHEPDPVAELFDKVIVLAKQTSDNCGHLAFYGTVREAYSFFGVNSLVGVVRLINREDEGGDGKADYFIEKYNRYIACK